jgi:predicted nucleic acid-binding protein
VVGTHKAPGEAVAVLEDLTADDGHVFIEALPPVPTAAAFFKRLLGHQQVTDAYLLAIAHRAGATLLTLDRRIVVPAGYRRLVEVLPPL